MKSSADTPLKELTIGVIGELNDRCRVTAGGVYSCLDIPQRSNIAADAQRQHSRNDIARSLDDQKHPKRNHITLIRSENCEEVDDETGTGDGRAECNEGNLNRNVLQNQF